MRCTLLSVLFLNLAASATTTPTTTIIRNARDPALNSTRGAAETFTGTAWIDTGLRDNDTSIANVVFEPGARTFWHTHEGGQLLQATAGSGWVCDEGGQPQRLDVGDVAWCPPGVTHWHGADEGSVFVHFAVAFGRTTWLDEVVAG